MKRMIKISHVKWDSAYKNLEMQDLCSLFLNLFFLIRSDSSHVRRRVGNQTKIAIMS